MKILPKSGWDGKAKADSVASFLLSYLHASHWHTLSICFFYGASYTIINNGKSRFSKRKVSKLHRTVDDKQKANTRITVNWFIEETRFFLQPLCSVIVNAKLYVVMWCPRGSFCSIIVYASAQRECQMPPYNTTLNAFHNPDARQQQETIFAQPSNERREKWVSQLAFHLIGWSRNPNSSSYRRAFFQVISFEDIFMKINGGTYEEIK